MLCLKVALEQTRDVSNACHKQFRTDLVASVGAGRDHRLESRPIGTAIERPSIVDSSMINIVRRVDMKSILIALQVRRTRPAALSGAGRTAITIWTKADSVTLFDDFSYAAGSSK